ncbi:hypothetical protein HN51_022399 [Arachis hypogaea]|uniref:Cyclin-dependent kinase inhibitor n=2 Tax=Arachis TaxID=3817 RepID=A0A445ECP6_ARAHY|nr:cyclin-dependent kinase inhibitor 3 [Arachis duranensis]XP_025650982.1 cyclin-dependent kinase inhibitor 3 [Arachis hypogaea]XP_057741901.1 cyclin-dependent kinase inhibitor 3 [Arachis stenosperma]QHO53618.1 Cyclin-dependent kinase inhibitor [Arachis hypogaea]RYR73198.1 hypothetical protein Ahy_A02g007543 [Arachis hypogaea]
MGKYMKKSKMGGEVAVMEVSSSSSAPSPMGVRTRAKTLALQKSPPSPPPSSAAAPSFDYIQLRSRRLQKVLVRPKNQPPAKQSGFCGGAAGVTSRMLTEQKRISIDAEENAEFSFGENTLEAEARDRSTRESTPCSLIRDSNAIETPGSTTRQRTSSTFTSPMILEHIQRNIPTTYEMEEFFACAEKQQQKIFMDKYNYDIVNDVPLSGRYEWVQVHH